MESTCLPKRRSCVLSILTKNGIACKKQGPVSVEARSDMCYLNTHSPEKNLRQGEANEYGYKAKIMQTAL